MMSLSTEQPKQEPAVRVCLQTLSGLGIGPPSNKCLSDMYSEGEIAPGYGKIHEHMRDSTDHRRQH